MLPIIDADSYFFAEAELPQQRVIDGAARFPAVLVPGAAGPGRLLDAVREARPKVEALLRRSGAVLLRGFAVRRAEDFNAAVTAFGYEELPYVGGIALRTKVVGRVFTANESPPDQKIPFHHEMSHVREFPSKLFFFCEEEPKSGGETPIVLSHLVHDMMKEKHPEFVAKLEELGLSNTRVLGDGDDLSSSVGRGWQSTFLTSDKTVAAERAAKLGMKIEWMTDGMKVKLGPIPAVKLDESRGRKVWFNSMAAAYTGLTDARNDPIKAVMFGDGSPLPAEIVEDCARILEEQCVAVPWKQGDILLVDNLAVQHSRRWFEPPRRILVSLCK